MDYCLGIRKLANKLSRPFIDKDVEKKLIKQNQKMINKLKHCLLENNKFLLSANCQAII